MDLVDHLQTISDLLESFTSAIGRIELLVRSTEGGSREDTNAAVRQLIREHDHDLEELTAKLDYLDSNCIRLAKETGADRLLKRNELISRLVREQGARASGSLDSLDHALFFWPTEAQSSESQQLADAVVLLKEVVSRWREEWMPRVVTRLAHLPDMEESAHQKQRRANLENIKSLAIEPYPHKFERSHTISQVVERFGAKTSEQFETERVDVRVAGRIHAINKMGKAAFIRFSDGAELLQIYIKSNEIDERTWALFKLLDLGDFIGAEGRLFRTRTGELSIHVESLTFLTKALVPPPDKYYGLHDIEIRYRQRYADLIANRDVRRVFEKRAQIVRLVRTFFDARGYIEVETPMLTPLPTGAAARPFVTHHNALDIDLYARIAPELYLKRLIVGGFEKVYEINRNFRNEGIDRSHNPEFTMLEFYEAYSDFECLVELTESLISGLVEQVCGQNVVQYGEQEIDFTRPWKRFSMRQAIVVYWPHPWERGEPGSSETLREVVGLACDLIIPHHPGQCESCDAARNFQLKAASLGDDQAIERDAHLYFGGLTVDALSTREGILRWTERHPVLKSQISNLKSLPYGYLLGKVFEEVAEPHLINPTLITEFPTELSPLSKQSETDPAFVDRFELFISGMEIANAFCEINDPKDQQTRFESQMTLRQGGDDEAMLIDEDYIRALSYGMPPTAGEGIGIDRLVMVLTDSRSIRDVILFPHMRPERAKGEEQSAKP